MQTLVFDSFEVLLFSFHSYLVKAIDKEIQDLYVKVHKVRIYYELMFQ